MENKESCPLLMVRGEVMRSFVWAQERLHANIFA